ncbi:GNAT family N-acetyltransferase [Mannheimia sp. E30BD]|uniref:GNAT family N-acetyltransferase n=1 Tax=Mannheimia sp. E30BD TaxID=3278708 RepID=UPI00359E482D
MQYSHYEWKCDSLNEPSKKAVEHLGFHYEGRFRQAMVYKGRNSDTNWYAMINGNWQQDVFEQSLNPSNFDENGQHIQSLQPNHKQI